MRAPRERMVATRYIEESSWFPVYSLGDREVFGQVAIELSAAELADYERVMGEFKNWQDRLREAMKSSN